MSEQPHHSNPLNAAPVQQDVAASIAKIAEQLAILEKKIDILISQSQARPFGEKQFSRPFRSFSQPYRRSDRGPDTSSGGKSFDRGRYFEKRRGEDGQGFGHKKKTHDNPRETNFGQGRHYEKRHGGEKRGFDHKKKPFYYKQKDR